MCSVTKDPMFAPYDFFIAPAPAAPPAPDATVPADAPRGTWQHGDGLQFIDCDRPAIDLYATDFEGSTGLHQFLIQTGTTPASGRGNGRPDRLPNAFGCLQMLLPDEGAPLEGTPTRTLVVSMTPQHLHSRIADLATAPVEDRRGRTCMSNFSVTLLSAAHDAGIDRGLPGHELYFEDLRLAIESRLITLYLRCILGVEQAPETMSPTIARHVLEFIEDNLGSNLHLDDLSEVAGLSKFHFSRAFRQTLGMSPHAFVMSRRLARVMDLLRNRLPVGRIAALCGFSDHAHLTRQFKRSFGTPPSAFNVR